MCNYLGNAPEAHLNLDIGCCFLFFLKKTNIQINIFPQQSMSYSLTFDDKVIFS